MDKTPAVIFGDFIAAYGAIRSLGPKGIPIYVVSPNGKGLAIRSRYVKKSLVLEADHADFLARLKRWIAQEVGSEAVLMVAGDDEYLDALSRDYSSLEPNLKCCFPSWRIAQRVRQKRRTYAIAESIGIPVPKTFYVQSQDELKCIVDNGIMHLFPLLMKSERSNLFLDKYKKKGIVANNEKDLLENYKMYKGFFGELLLQEMIPGEECQLLNLIGVYNKHSEPISVFMNRKRRSSGEFLSCTLMETMWCPEVLAYSNLLIKKIGYFGYANPEYKYDMRDGKIKLMEINGRISLSNSHAFRCGIDVINALYCDSVAGSSVVQPHIGNKIPNNILWWMPIGDIMSSMMMVSNGTLKTTQFFRSLIGSGYIMEPINFNDLNVLNYHLIQRLRKMKGHIIKRVSESISSLVS